MDGVNGMCYEHSVSEGVVVATAVQRIIKSLEAIYENSMKIVAREAKYTKMKFSLSEQLKGKIRKAATHLNTLNNDTDVEVLFFRDFGKIFMKACKCSPDAFVQMSLQLAYYTIYKKLCPTYESASTRRFHWGRVDAIRASHSEALAWVKSMKDSKSKQERLNLFISAMVKQTQIMTENIFGEGMDIALLGIRKAAEHLWPEETLPIFADPAFHRANKFNLSTSQMTIDLKQSYMGYGAVLPDGYCVSYNLQNDEIIFAICSFFSCENTNSRRFANALSASLKEMRELFN